MKFCWISVAKLRCSKLWNKNNHIPKYAAGSWSLGFILDSALTTIGGRILYWIVHEIHFFDYNIKQIFTKIFYKFYNSVCRVPRFSESCVDYLIWIGSFITYSTFKKLKTKRTLTSILSLVLTLIKFPVNLADWYLSLYLILSFNSQKSHF